MLDVAVAYNKYKFLGNDFLTWIWFSIENQRDFSALLGSKDSITLQIGNSIVLENQLGDKSKEKITIKGDQAGLEEGVTALKKGAYVTQINLILKINEDEYQFTIKGESFNITGLKTPKTDLAKTGDQIEGLVIEKAFFCFTVFQMIDTLFLKYLALRSSDDWHNNGLTDIKNWITSF